MLTEKELTQFLEENANAPEFGGGFDFDSSWSKVSQELGFEEKQESSKYSFRDFMEFGVWQTSHVIAKPVATMAVFMLLVLVGWVATVNGTMNTMPGDNLYPVKIGIEQVQMALATTADQKAGLKMEFTTRRLDEMVTATSSSAQDRDVRVQVAMKNFKDEVSTIKDQLSEENAAPELARALGRKAESYSSTVASAQDLSPEALVEAEEVQEIIEDTKYQAVEVILTTHEEEKDEESMHELTLAYDNEVSDLQEKNDALSTSQAVVAFDDRIELADKLMEEGLYRRAFQVLRELRIEISQTVEQVEEASSTPLIQQETEMSNDTSDEIN